MRVVCNLLNSGAHLLGLGYNCLENFSVCIKTPISIGFMMTIQSKKRIRSDYFRPETLKMLDSENPKFSMFILAHEMVKNCFAEKYQFRNMPMFHRLAKHGVLPKSFFRQNFQRCSKLLELIEITEYTIDQLTDEVCESDLLIKMELFERNENKTFYHLAKKD